MNTWEENADRRREQIRSGLDLSYIHVLMPAIIDSLPKPDGRAWMRLLDAGCGPGVLAERLWEIGWRVTAIDKSAAMIRIARRDSGRKDRLTFANLDFQDLPGAFARSAFDVVVANMSLTGVGDLGPSLAAMREVLRRRGRLVLTDVHPWFWRQYKGHSDRSYWETFDIAESLSISLDPEPLPAPVTVVYRPLGQLCRAILNGGFAIERLEEPRPTASIEEQYPSPWRYPRFILLSALRK